MGSARAIRFSLTFSVPFLLLLPLATRGAGVIIYGAGFFVFGLGATVYNINQGAFRQQLCPDRLRGRVNATARLMSWSTPPVGGVLGGLLGAWLGNRDAILLAAVGAALSPVWFIVGRPFQGDLARRG